MLEAKLLRILAVSAMGLALVASACSRPSPPPPAAQRACDPWNASYLVEGRSVRLTAGRAVTDIIPGAASRTTTNLFGSAAFGDLDEDDRTDAAMIVARDTGGSGTFFYAAALLDRGDTCQGTNAVFLGDRIVPRDVSIRNAVVAVRSLERRMDQPMSAAPSLPFTRYLVIEKNRLTEIPLTEPGEKVSAGWITIGDEVRAFRPCSQNTDLWLRGDSPALKEIMAAHHLAAADEPPYAPVFMILAGIDRPAPREGFGADFAASFKAIRLVKSLPEGYCRKELIRVEAPRPRSPVVSPLRVRGEARGDWFFEGDFPLVLTDARGQVIAKGFATAKGPWMTRDFVPFEGSLEFSKPAFGGWGMLVFKKDNPTGLPQHDDALSVPVRFE
jgi:hypothetical protein